jgi:hypothetical protein
MGPGPGLLLALALASGGVDLEAGLSTGARARSVSSGGAGWDHTVELVAVPRLELVAERPDWRLSAGYAPRLTAPDVLSGDRVDAWQVALLDALLRASPTLRLEAGAIGAVGTSSLLSDAWRTTGPETVRTADRVRHFDLRAGLAAEAQLDRIRTLTLVLIWSRGGGSDATSRALLPVEETLQLDAWLRWRVSLVDVLELRLAASGSRLEVGTRATLATVSGRWDHGFDQGWSAWAGAGGGLVATEGPTGAEPTRGTWLAAAGMRHEVAPLRFWQQLAVRAAPGVDRLQGTVDQSLQGDYEASLGRLPGWWLRGRVLAAMTRRTPGTDHLALLELRLERGLTRHLTVGAGVQGSRQRSTDPALPALVEWIGLAGLEWWPTGRPEVVDGPMGTWARARHQAWR